MTATPNTHPSESPMTRLLEAARSGRLNADDSRRADLAKLLTLLPPPQAQELIETLAETASVEYTRAVWERARDLDPQLPARLKPAAVRALVSALYDPGHNAPLASAAREAASAGARP